MVAAIARNLISRIPARPAFLRNIDRRIQNLTIRKISSAHRPLSNGNLSNKLLNVSYVGLSIYAGLLIHDINLLHTRIQYEREQAEGRAYFQEDC